MKIKMMSQTELREFMYQSPMKCRVNKPSTKEVREHFQSGVTGVREGLKIH